MNTDSRLRFPTRITMLDANTLDSEVFNILKLQAEKVLHIFPPWLITKVELQLDLFLNFLIWKLSVNKFHGTFGQQLLNVKYPEDNFTLEKSYIICLSKILYCYHGHRNITSLFQNKNVSDYFQWLEIACRIFSIINLLRFFQEGKYPTMLDRVLCLRPVCIVNRPREVGYRYMTRELIWHGFIELAGFTLTLVNYQSLKRKFWRIFLQSKKQTPTKHKLVYTVSTRCEICNDTPVLPQHMSCSHVFCYYCIQSNRIIDARYECPSCGYFQEEILFYSTS